MAENTIEIFEGNGLSGVTGMILERVLFYSVVA